MDDNEDNNKNINVTYKINLGVVAMILGLSAIVATGHIKDIEPYGFWIFIMLLFLL